MIEELRFAIRCHGSTKKPRLRRRCSQCAAHSATFAGPVPPAPVNPPPPGPFYERPAASNGLLTYQPAPYAAADEILHRRRARVPHDQRDVTADSYYATTAKSRYAANTVGDDVTEQRSDVTNDYCNTGNKGDMLRHYDTEPSYGNSGKI